MDNTLEGKVKITVLATGFGMEDVPGMDSVLEKRSQEEEERQLQLEEEKEKNKERIRKAYGESASGIGSKTFANADISISSTPRIWIMPILSAW